MPLALIWRRDIGSEQNKGLRMKFAATDPTPSLARWTSRAGIFSGGLALSALFMHRLLGMPTPTALNLFKLSFAGALLTIVLGVLASARIWRTGEEGAARVLVGFLLAGGLLSWPLSQLPLVLTLPNINDLTTDPADPPPFTVLGASRAPGANGAVYPGETFAKAQAAAYSDIRALDFERSSAEAFGLATDALRNKLFMTIRREQPPNPETGEAGYIEAEDQTFVMGFVDDVAIRVKGDDKRARIDIRSASRFGTHDLGRNAERMRRILRELVLRLEETVPAPKSETVTLKSRKERAEFKEQKVRRRKPARRRLIYRY